MLRNFVLSELSIQDFRCFGELQWSGINPAGPGDGRHESVSNLNSQGEIFTNLNVLVGPNMSGKTSLLQAIAVALSPFVRHFVTNEGPGIGREDVRRVSDPNMPSRVVQDPVEIKARFSVAGECVVSRVTRGASASARTRWPSADELKHLARRLSEAHAAGELLPIIAMYGTQRLWGEVSTTTGRRGVDWADGYRDCLDPRSSYEVLLDWVNVTTRTVGSKSAAGRPERSLGLLSELVQIVLKPMGISSVEYQLDGDDFFAEVTQPMLADVSAWNDIWSDRFEQMWLPVSSLSDGVRTMVGLVGDIARRISLLNAGLPEVDLRETPGIIMIDEVDLHLHPVWQQQVLATLCEALPKVQWIVTTHSPQVVSTAPRTSVWMLDAQRDDEGRRRSAAWAMTHPQRQTQGVESGDVLAQVFQVDPMPQTSWRRRLRNLQVHADMPQAEFDAEIESLTDHFGDDYYALKVIRARRARLLSQG